MSTDPCVAVAGAGPVGLCAALTLAQRGVPVTVFEKGPTLSSESRASTFHPPTLELLDDLGVVEPLLAIGLRAPTTQFRDRANGLELVAELDLSVLADVTKYPFRVQCEQNKLAAIVLDRLGEYPHVEVRFEHRVVAARNDPAGHVVLETETPEGPGRVTAPYLIACDGAHSRVRESLGIPFEGVTYPERYLVISTTQELADLVPGLGYVSYVADPEQWCVLLRTPDHWRVLFPITDDTDEAAQSPERVQELLDDLIPLPHPWPVSHTSLYVVNRRVARDLRAGRVLLAGDAAHVNSPLGGMGMNSGIQDAVSAGRRLASVWHGELDDAALDEYGRLRHAVAAEYVGADSHRNYQVLREADPVKRAEYRDELRATVADPARLRAHMLRTSMLDAVRSSL